LDTSTTIHIEIHKYTNHTAKENKYTECAPQINITAVFELLKINWGVENSLSIPDTYEVKMKTAI